MNNDNQNPSDWSLKDAIKQRRKQAARQEADARLGRPSTPTPSPMKPASTTPLAAPPVRATPPAARKTGTAQRITGTQRQVSATGRSSLPAGSSIHLTRRQAMVAAIVLISTLIIGFGGGLVAISQTGGQTPPSAAMLPILKATDFVEQLKTSGLALQNIRTIVAPNTTWNARQQLQFDAQQGSGRGTFIVLSYDSANQAGSDAFSASVDERFKKWMVNQSSNILLLSSPGTPSSLSRDMASRLLQFAVVPYVGDRAKRTPGS